MVGFCPCSERFFSPRSSKTEGGKEEKQYSGLKKVVSAATSCNHDLTLHMYAVGGHSTKDGAIKSKAAKGG